MASNVESAPGETLVTILFADVVGSTQLYEALGDEGARATVQKCVDIMKDATEQYGGTVIKTIGDEVMSTFPSADDAMNAGSQMQKRITNNYQITDGGVPVAIRIGCHYGPVVIEDRDISGLSVITANRMTSQAKAGQIITTAVTVEQLSGEWRALVRQIDVATVRGQSGEVAVFEVLWQPEEATSMLPSINGLGIRENAIYFLFSPFVGQKNAFILSLFWLFTLLLAGAVGGIIHLFARQSGSETTKIPKEKAEV